MHIAKAVSLELLVWLGLIAICVPRLKLKCPNRIPQMLIDALIKIGIMLVKEQQFGQTLHMPPVLWMLKHILGHEEARKQRRKLSQ